MKQTLLLTLSFFAITSSMIASTDEFIDKMAVVGSPGLSSAPCAVIDKKIMRLDRFTEVVISTSAFHLEEKATALPVPGITVSNNKKKMLRDAKKKYAQYSAELQKYGCETAVSTSTTANIAEIKAVASEADLSSDTCAKIDRKVMKLDKFTEVVKNTSAFHLEEKATALPVPGITVSNNKKKMLRDADKKYAEYSAERQKYGCETPMRTSTVQVDDKKAVTSRPTSLSSTRTVIDKEPIKPAALTTKVNNTNAVDVEEKSSAEPVQEITKNNNNEELLSDIKKKDAEPTQERQKYSSGTPSTAGTGQVADKKTVTSEPALSSEECDAINKKLIKLYEFTIMVNNTSAFHLEEKAEALSIPGITVSNNKKKMLRDADKKGAELLAERKKYGCETAED